MNSMISLVCLIAFFICSVSAGPVFPYASAAYSAYGKGYYTPLLPGPSPVAAVPAAPAVPALPFRYAAPGFPARYAAPAFPARYAAPGFPAPAAALAAPVAPAAAVVPEYYPYAAATAALNYLGYPYGYPYSYGAYVAPYKK